MTARGRDGVLAGELGADCGTEDSEGGAHVEPTAAVDGGAASEREEG